MRNIETVTPGELLREEFLEDQLKNIRPWSAESEV